MKPSTRSSVRIRQLAPAFLAQRLLQQQNASPRTVVAYRDTFRLPLTYTERTKGKPPAKLALCDFDATWRSTSSHISKPNATTRYAAAMHDWLRSVPLPTTWPCNARLPWNSLSKSSRDPIQLLRAANDTHACGRSARPWPLPRRRRSARSRAGSQDLALLGATRRQGTCCRQASTTVIALWLGHESPVTTHGYIEAD